MNELSLNTIGRLLDSVQPLTPGKGRCPVKGCKKVQKVALFYTEHALHQQRVDVCTDHALVAMNEFIVDYKFPHHRED